MSTNRKPKTFLLTAAAMGATGAALFLMPLQALQAQTQVAFRSPAPPAKKTPAKQTPAKQTPAKQTPAKKPVLKKRGLDDYALSAISLRHWQASKVLIYVIPAVDDTRSAGETRALVAQGIDLWKDKIQAKDSALNVIVTNDPDTADIKISFVPAGSLSGGRIGVTDVLFTVPQQVIVRATIRLVEGLTDDQLIQAVAHESGHALGIQGHSDAKSDLMYPYAHLPPAVTPRDARTIDIAYAKVTLLGDRGPIHHPAIQRLKPEQKTASVTSD